MATVWKSFKLSWPQVLLVALVLTAFVVSYFLPVEIRAEMRADLGWFWGIVSTFLGPIVKRKLMMRGGDE